MEEIGARKIIYLVLTHLIVTTLLEDIYAIIEPCIFQFEVYCNMLHKCNYLHVMFFCCHFIGNLVVVVEKDEINDKLNLLLWGCEVPKFICRKHAIVCVPLASWHFMDRISLVYGRKFRSLALFFYGLNLAGLSPIKNFD